MKKISRKKFLQQAGIASSAILVSSCQSLAPTSTNTPPMTIAKDLPINQVGEGLIAYLQRTAGQFDLTTYRQLIGAANPFKEGDETLGIAAVNEAHRTMARQLLTNTTIKEIDANIVFKDELQELIHQTTKTISAIADWTLGQLKKHILTQSEKDIKAIMPSLSSDVIGCVVKLMSNEELIILHVPGCQHC